jgi:hypothetical protein
MRIRIDSSSSQTRSWSTRIPTLAGRGLSVRSELSIRIFI